MRKIAICALSLGAMCAAGLWITRPQSLDPSSLENLVPDAARGEVIFAAMGCASCHTADGEEDPRVLAGGHAFKTEFGTFYAPNISTDPIHGIGTWSDLDIANAILKGTSPAGSHYYPVFPYPSYGRAELTDIADLTAYLRTLPASSTPNKAHEVAFPFQFRVALGGWKLLFFNTDFVINGDLTPEQQRGRVLVEALAHCGECHTPRNALGGPDLSQWLAGGPAQTGPGKIPDIRPQTLQWSQRDIVEYLTSGFTPDYDSAGGEMADVIENTSKLPESDRQAIAAYLLIDREAP